MELKEFDIVLRNISETENTHYRLIIVGHEDEMTFESETTMGCIRQLNISLWDKSYKRRERQDKALNSLREQLRKDAGVKWYHFGIKKVPEKLRDLMTDLVDEVCKEQRGLTYEQVAKEVLRRWNQCPDIDRMGHECSAYCHQKRKS